MKKIIVIVFLIGLFVVAAFYINTNIHQLWNDGTVTVIDGKGIQRDKLKIEVGIYDTTNYPQNNQAIINDRRNRTIFDNGTAKMNIPYENKHEYFVIRYDNKYYKVCGWALNYNSIVDESKRFKYTFQVFLKDSTPQLLIQQSGGGISKFRSEMSEIRFAYLELNEFPLNGAAAHEITRLKRINNSK